MSIRCLAASVLLAVLLPAAAHASTVTAGSPSFAITAGAGETNTMTVAYVPPTGSTAEGWTIHDTTSPVTCGGGYAACQQVDANTVFAPNASVPAIQTGNGSSSVSVDETGVPYVAQTRVTGGTGNDVLTMTGPHNDSLAGGAGNDTLNGGAGGDELDGQAGDDTVHGGAGDDTLDTAASDGADVLDGGGGTDVVSYASRAAAVSITEDGAANDGTAGEGDNVASVESLTGTNYGDTIVASGTRSGGTLAGGPGNDVLSGSNGGQAIDGGPGDDTLAGNGGNDAITGGSGNDVITGGSGNDTIGADTGNDSIDGGTGNDGFGGIGSGDGADAWNGGAGYDTIDYSSDSGPVTISEDGAANDGEAGEGDNVAADIEEISGTTDADTITGSSADNVLFGNGGADTLSGGAGRDTLTVGCCAAQGIGATLNGGDGADALIGSTSDDVFNGGAGDDTLVGSGGADVFNGGEGVDTVSFFDSVPTGVDITPDGKADDGLPGEGANVMPDVEDLIGSTGADTISGAPGVVNRIDGAGGGDTIDVASSPADADTVLCRSGGSAFGISRRRIAGVFGTNTYNDVVTADVLDDVSRSGDTACATVHQPEPAPATAPRLSVLATKLVASGGVFTVPLGCTAAAPRCRVTAQVSSARGTILGIAHGVIGVGKRAQVLFRLSPLRRAWLAKGRTLRLRLAVDVSDSTHKTRTVNRRLEVRGRR